MTNKKSSTTSVVSINKIAALATATNVAAAAVCFYGVIVVCIALSMNLFNDTSARYVLPISIIPLALGVSFIVQAIKIFRGPDTGYWLQKLSALLLMLSLPIGWLMFGMLYAGHSETATIRVVMIVIVAISALLTLAGTTWLWVLLLSSKKELPKKSRPKRKAVVAQSATKTAARHRLGIQLLLLPVILIALNPLLGIILSTAGPQGESLAVVMAIPVLALKYLWLHSIIVGAYLLYKNPKQPS